MKVRELDVRISSADADRSSGSAGYLEMVYGHCFSNWFVLELFKLTFLLLRIVEHHQQVALDLRIASSSCHVRV